jgi:hypothetical protein
MALRIFTSITANYIPKARVLAHSVKRFHPDVHFTAVIADRVPELDLSREPFDALLALDDLNIPDLRAWIFKHSLVELSTAVKGFALLKLLGGHCSQAVYFDPDIVVLAPLDALLHRFESASILLTPHLTEPESSVEAILDNEVCALQHGVYNLGFLGVRNSEQGVAFARWWANRLTNFCRDDIPGGLFTDQRWMDLAPGYFDDIAILRDPVYNVATWNLSRRTVEGGLEDGLSIGGRKIVFYHFSGLDSGAQFGMLNKYGSGMPGLYQLREWYLKECDRLEQSTFSAIPWAYGCFDNGAPILPSHRKRYRDNADLQSRFPDPFAATDTNRSYYHWFNAHPQIEAGSRAGRWMRVFGNRRRNFHAR